MVDFKKIISSLIEKEININVYNSIKEIEDPSKGDYTFPCFSLSKELHKSPMEIADSLSTSIKDDRIEKIESVNGYLNFFINKEYLIKEVLTDYDSNRSNYGKEDHKETILVEYSSPNIAKPFHVGHLRSTVIGHALYNVYKYLGYNTISINHLGDYGTQFGKLIEGYKLWGSEYDLNDKPIDKLVEIYIRINALCEEDEDALRRCRENFKLLEEGDEYCTSLWKKFSELSLKEFDKIYDLLGVKFDVIKGESFYIDKMPEMISILEKNNKLTVSEGAKVVDLEDQGIKTPCIIVKSDGSSIYATRDLAAILYRARTFDYTKSLYVVACEQDLAFKQVFATAKYLDLDEKYVKGLEHVSFGMYRLPEGKFSTRKGNFVKLEDILNASINKAKEVIMEKNPELENLDEVATKVGVGAVVFSDLYNSRIKDEVFDLDEMMKFNGETSPYIQYMYVRIKSILRKNDTEVLLNNVKYDKLLEGSAYELVKLVNKFNDVLNDVINKNEPYFLSRYLIKLATTYSEYYNEVKILSDDEEERNSRLYLVTVVSEILKTGCNLLGIEMPERM